jgi:hypothetical protein
MTRTKLIAATAVPMALWAACTISPRGYAAAPADDDEKSIQLPVLPSDLPPGKGVEVVNAACVICHSTRYITMQPNFSRKAWTGEVDKMRKVFGAPVSDAQAGQIVEYLMSVKGVADKPQQ